MKKVRLIDRRTVQFTEERMRKWLKKGIGKDLEKEQMLRNKRIEERIRRILRKE